MNTRFWCCVLMGIAGCAMPDAARRNRPEPSTPPPRYRAPVAIPMPDHASSARAADGTVTLRGRDVAIRDLLLTLFRDSNLNLLVDPSIDGTATFDIKSATVEDAFDALMRHLDLDYVVEGEFVTVRPTTRRLIPLNVIHAGGGEGSNAGPWASLQKDLTEIIGSNGKALINKEAGTLLLEGPPSRVAQAQQYLDHALRRIRSQVSLEARVLEVRLSDDFQAGVNWSLLGGLLSGDFQGALGGGAFASGGAAAGGSLFNLGILRPDKWSVFVDALESQGQVRVLSSPRVSTMNNVNAEIRVVDQIPVIDREIVDSDGGLRTQFDVRFVESGITLAVTPQVGDDGHVTVSVTPSVTEQTGTVVTPDGLQTEPILSTRTATSTVRVKDGQAVVIGGLRSTRKNETLSMVPGLGRVPVVGHLFRSNVQEREEVELVVLLVPRVMKGTWTDREVQRAASRLRKVRRRFFPSTRGLENPREDYRGGFLLDSESSFEPRARSVKHVVPSKRRESGPNALSRKGLLRLLVRRARDLDRRGSRAEAEPLWDQALELAPEDLDLRVEAALAAAAGEDRARARRMLESVLRARPDDAVVRNALGVLCMEFGEVGTAARHFRHAYERNGDGLSVANYAASLLELDRWKQAKELLDAHAARSDSWIASGWMSLAYVRLKAGENSGARAAYEKALAAGLHADDPASVAVRLLASRSPAPKTE